MAESVMCECRCNNIRQSVGVRTMNKNALISTLSYKSYPYVLLQSLLSRVTLKRPLMRERDSPVSPKKKLYVILKRRRLIRRWLLCHHPHLHLLFSYFLCFFGFIHFIDPSSLKL